MTSLRQALADYLAMRRAMGYRLARAEKLLGQFLTYLEERRETRLRTRTALAGATLPPGNPSGWWTSRLAVVRGFATYLHTVDPITEIPPTDLLRAHARRATPYPYSDEDIANLLALALEGIGWGTADHWMRMQASYELAQARRQRTHAGEQRMIEESARATS